MRQYKAAIIAVLERENATMRALNEDQGRHIGLMLRERAERDVEVRDLNATIARLTQMINAMQETTV
jgi:t-SNARE complex subunit (syntaxin)